VGDASLGPGRSERSEGSQRRGLRGLTFGRLSGLDRSGPPPPETLAGAPLRPWTIPNAIGYVRLALIPAFLVLAYRSAHGHDTLATVIYAVIGWSDYADGIAARVTGQYSRLGALLDPVVDRLLVISGVAVCWSYDLLPRWALAVLVAREVLMLLAGRYLQTHGVELKINMLGRWGVWPTMSAIFAGLVGWLTVGEILIYIGLAMALGATVLYTRSGLAQLREADARL
jgi:CDP-diacylglycerol--glycerol-3-phosphate 3-phosphatidyltransferase